MQQQQQPVAMLCLQAVQVAGLPDAADGRHIQLQLMSTTTSTYPAPVLAVCRAGVADFHRQLLLLHCAPVNSIDVVALTVTMRAADTCNVDLLAARVVVIASVNVDLAEQLRRPSPSVLTFELGGASATAATGAVLSLTLHHRLLQVTRTGTGCSSLLRSCLRVPALAAGCCPPVPVPVLRTTTKQNRQHHHQGRPAEDAAQDDGSGGAGGDSSSSSGFITIEKGTISRRRPPSDYLLTTTDDDDEVDGKRPPGPGPPTTTTTCCWSLSSLDDDTKVENDFLAMLMLEEEDDDDDDDDLDQLDALIKYAEADLAAIWPSRRG